MLVTKKRYEIDMTNARREFNSLNQRYWDLSARHDLLLAHLGLTERKVTSKIELVTKGSPERDV